MIEINAEVNKRVGLRFEDMMRPASFKAVVIVFACLFEILQFAMNPPNAIRQARKPETIAVSLGHLNPIFERRQRFGDSPQIPTRQPKRKERQQYQKSVTDLSRDFVSFN